MGTDSIREPAKRFGVQYVPEVNISPSDYLPHYRDNYRRLKPQTNGCTTLIGMIANGSKLSDIELRVASRPDQVTITSNQQWTALHMVCVCANFVDENMYADIMCVLLDAGANINAQDEIGYTPLMRLVERGMFPVALFNILVDRQCDVNLRNNTQATALHLYYATNKYDLQIVSPILDAHFDINNTTDDGKNVLMIFLIRCPSPMLSKNRMQHVQLLIDRGTNLDAQDSDGNTVLHIATHRGLAELVPILINGGADVNIRNNLGETPIMQPCLSYYAAYHLRKAGATDRAPRCCCCSLI